MLSNHGHFFIIIIKLGTYDVTTLSLLFMKIVKPNCFKIFNSLLHHIYVIYVFFDKSIRNFQEYFMTLSMLRIFIVPALSALNASQTLQLKSS